MTFVNQSFLLEFIGKKTVKSNNFTLCIVSKGVQALKIPVTAKIRVFEDIEKSVKYAKMVESTGISVNTYFFFRVP